MSTHRTIRCLIIDDSLVAHHICDLLLSDVFAHCPSLSIVTARAQTIREAVVYCIIHDVDLIFLDAHMENDVCVLEAVRSLHTTFVGRNVPYIVVRTIDVSGEVFGADHTFPSPLSHEKIEGAIKSFLDHRGFRTT